MKYDKLICIGLIPTIVPKILDSLNLFDTK